MTKVVYTSEPESLSWRRVLPWQILQDLLRHRELIISIVSRDVRAAYRASYLGLAWQILLPVIMLSIFYLVFGEILGGRFAPSRVESPVDYALALFVGLGFFNFLAQNIGSASSLIMGNASFVKTLSFPLEVLPLTTVLNALLNLVIGLLLVTIVLLVVNGSLHLSAICLPLYVLCIFLLAVGVSWGLSALAVFVRDVSAVTSPLTLVLMFMCPIFYPASLVPKKIKWVVDFNPVAIIIEDARAAILYGVWPSLIAATSVFLVSLGFAVCGYFFFMRLKPAFADVI